MKKLIALVFLFTIYNSLSAQNRLFVRVYDLQDQKIAKGFILAVNDSVLRMKKDTTFVDIPVKTIGRIRTKRSIGNNLLIGTLVGSTLFATIGVATADPDAWAGYDAGEGAIIGTIVGAPTGALIGLFTVPFKNSKKFIIDGDLEKWKAFETFLLERSSP